MKRERSGSFNFAIYAYIQRSMILRRSDEDSDEEDENQTDKEKEEKFILLSLQ